MKFKTELPESLDFSSSSAITSTVVDEHGKAVIVTRRAPERKAGEHCKRVLRIAFTQIGLVLILIGYLVGGGFLFRALELDNESSVCYQKLNGYLKKLNSSASRVIGTVESTLDVDRRDSLVRDIMANFAEQLFILDFQPSTDCTTILGTDHGGKWNLANAIYFCATIVTTIGYGHIVPVTFWGRISCIVYAVIGIPLMLIYLAIIGNLLARIFRMVYVNIICCRCFYDVIRRKRQKQLERLRRWEQDLREHEEEEARRRGLPVPPSKVQAVVVDEDESEDADMYREKVVAVPLTVSIIILAAYTLIGAVLFPQWEDWNLADSAYFSFITISTIGFGDLVPGTGRLTEPETAVELAIGALYLVLGLALVSMCINLLQDEMVAKIKYMASCCSGGHKVDADNAVDDENDENIKENTTKEDEQYLTSKKQSNTDAPDYEFGAVSVLGDLKPTNDDVAPLEYENTGFVND
ncbi:Potassium channel subfamily K 8 [Fasciola gigantica]|uniref:Potassium channel subfamily K 8 n=1 Tax=Fasciola gigantica TaxID=46835 RepID=A0A504YL98_FASGI|nr:Potassium channel subfamily K 8 [Fasciola gigantica]